MRHAAQGLAFEETGGDFSLEKFIQFIAQHKIQPQELDRINYKINKILALGQDIDPQQSYYLTKLSAAITYLRSPDSRAELPDETAITVFNKVNRRRKIQIPIQLPIELLDETRKQIEKMSPTNLRPLLPSMIKVDALHEVLIQKITTPPFWRKILQWFFSIDPLSNSQRKMIDYVKENHREFYDKHLHPEKIDPHIVLEQDSYLMMLDIPPSIKKHAGSTTPQISTEFVKTLLAKTNQCSEQFPQLQELEKYYTEYGQHPTFDLNLVRQFLLGEATYDPDTNRVSERPMATNADEQLRQLFQLLKPLSPENRDSITQLMGEKYFLAEENSASDKNQDDPSKLTRSAP